MSPGLWWMYTGIWFINLLLASFVGGWLYTEEESVRA